MIHQIPSFLRRIVQIKQIEVLAPRYLSTYKPMQLLTPNSHCYPSEHTNTSTRNRDYWSLLMTALVYSLGESF